MAIEPDIKIPAGRAPRRVDSARRKAAGATAAKKTAGKEEAPHNSHKVLIALRRIIRATDLHSKYLYKKSGLTIPQVIVLQSIRDLGEVTTGQISRRVSLSQGTVTSILDRLENNGLIERYRSVADRRVVHASLTRKGRAVLRKAPPLLHERFVEAFGALSGPGQERIVGVLEEVAEMMGADSLDAAPLLDIAAPPGGRASLPGSDLAGSDEGA